MRVAAYLTVSSQEQSTDNQLPGIEAWCDSRVGAYEMGK